VHLHPVQLEVELLQDRAHVEDRVGVPARGVYFATGELGPARKSISAFSREAGLRGSTVSAKAYSRQRASALFRCPCCQGVASVTDGTRGRDANTGGDEHLAA
jgi:hypothetical protein